MGLMISNLAEEAVELSLTVELRRTWLAAAERNQTLTATRLQYDFAYGSATGPLAATEWCLEETAPCGTFVTGRGDRPIRIRESLEAGAAVFLKLQQQA